MLEVGNPALTNEVQSMRKLEAGSKDCTVKFGDVRRGPFGGLLGDAVFLDLQHLSYISPAHDPGTESAAGWGRGSGTTPQLRIYWQFMVENGPHTHAHQNTGQGWRDGSSVKSHQLGSESQWCRPATPSSQEAEARVARSKVRAFLSKFKVTLAVLELVL